MIICWPWAVYLDGLKDAFGVLNLAAGQWQAAPPEGAPRLLVISAI